MAIYKFPNLARQTEGSLNTNYYSGLNKPTAIADSMGNNTFKPNLAGLNKTGTAPATSPGISQTPTPTPTVNYEQQYLNQLRARALQIARGQREQQSEGSSSWTDADQQAFDRQWDSYTLNDVFQNNQGDVQLFQNRFGEIRLDNNDPLVQQFAQQHGTRDWFDENGNPMQSPDSNNAVANGYVMGYGDPNYSGVGAVADEGRVFRLPDGRYIREAGNLNSSNIVGRQRQDETDSRQMRQRGAVLGAAVLGGGLALNAAGFLGPAAAGGSAVAPVGTLGSGTTLAGTGAAASTAPLIPGSTIAGTTGTGLTVGQGATLAAGGVAGPVGAGAAATAGAATNLGGEAVGGVNQVGVPPPGGSVAIPPEAGGATNLTNLFQGPTGRFLGSAASNIVGGLLTRDAANRSREDASAAARRADTWGDIGGRSESGYSLLDLVRDPSLVSKLPGYQFGLDQGNRMIENQAAKRGYFRSPNMLYGLTKFNADYNDSFYNQRLNTLARLAGVDFNPASAAQMQQQGNQQSNMANADSWRMFMNAGGDFVDWLFN